MVDLFRGRNVLIASGHRKEQVIQPLLESQLYLNAFVIAGLDTDQFGTFTGEIQRKDTPLETARKKCRWAMDQFGFDLAVASEGSFGPHPAAFLLPSDEEWVVLIDQKNQLDIFARALSLETNFQQAICRTIEELTQWAEKVYFPSHAIILSSHDVSASEIVKGINNTQTLLSVGRKFLDKYGLIYAQTDMRAMCNPMRLKVIEAATKTLTKKALSLCPVCQWPGFDVTEYQEGLPCAWCGTPTQEILCTVSECLKCGHQLLKHFPNQKTVANPGYCNYCNP